MKTLDLSKRKTISARDIENAVQAGVAELIVGTHTILRKSARQAMQKAGMPLRFSPVAAFPSDSRIERSFLSREASTVKDEICLAGHKLWQRSYVDGNGGNISCRVGDNEVICTPTMLSKGDITPGDLCLTDLDGNQLAGRLPGTSELLLHLEIYKAAPRARAVIHCHPPCATAYAIAGMVPPIGVIPEFDVLVGPVALTEYETPGTREFAESVKPHVQRHNTVILRNHGIVCWADTPTHAEWQVEVLENFCRTLLICKQLGYAYNSIPGEKQKELLELKRTLGFPDARFTPE